MQFWLYADEDPLADASIGDATQIKTLVDAARDRLDEILRQGDLDAFNVIDIEDEHGNAVNYDGTRK
jgi:hypothetical protein